jgi:CDI immunity protein
MHDKITLYYVYTEVPTRANMSSVPHTPWVNVYINNYFICLDTASGYRSYAGDPNVPPLFLALDVSESELGEAVVYSLSQSRQLDLVEARAFFDFRRIQQNYELFVDEMLKHANISSRKTLFRTMHLCQVTVYGDEILICPMHHEKLEAWSDDGISESSKIRLLRISSAAEIGRALRLGFESCL